MNFTIFCKKKESNMKTLLVDASNLGWVAGYSMQGLVYRGRDTGLFYGFLRGIFTVAEKYNPSVVIFVWDSVKNKRKTLVDGYKANRDESLMRPEDKALKDYVVYELGTIKHHLKDLGIKNSYEVTGLEADDIIASIIQKYPRFEHIIYSADSDLYQLLSDNVIQVSTRDSNKVITLESFKEKYGIEPEQWPLVKAIAGDSSDNIKGLPRIGEKTALKYIKGELKQSSKQYQLIQESGTIIDQNLKIIKLPLEYVDIQIKRESIHFIKWKSLLSELGFHSLLKPDKLELARKLFRLK